VEQLTELSYALDTFYFLMSGVLVMWMAAGFTMLEAGWCAPRTPRRS
jgi:ammonium transporter, Amt family